MAPNAVVQGERHVTNRIGGVSSGCPLFVVCRGPRHLLSWLCSLRDMLVGRGRPQNLLSILPEPTLSSTKCPVYTNQDAPFYGSMKGGRPSHTPRAVTAGPLQSLDQQLQAVKINPEPADTGVQ